jgi:anti-sigma B factor antagonist
MLEIKTEENGDQIVIKPEGKVDTNTASDLREEMVKHVDSFAQIIMDLEKMVYISSAGLRVFLELDQALKAKGKTLKVKNVNGPIMDVFEMTGFASVLEFE